jgi:hypothetical protein
MLRPVFGKTGHATVETTYDAPRGQLGRDRPVRFRTVLIQLAAWVQHGDTGILQGRALLEVSDIRTTKPRRADDWILLRVLHRMSCCYRS